MKKLTSLTIAAPLLLAASIAQAEVSANFGATSNYLWRGVTQSADGASVSGGLDYSNESGFYAGTWIGTIDWGIGNAAETDLYLGYSGEADGFSYDVGYVYYAYLESEYDGSDFGELYFKGAMADFNFSIAYTINSDADDAAPFGQGDLYYSVGYEFALSEDYSLALTVGHYDFDVDGALDADYSHAQLDLSKGDFTFSVSKTTDSALSDDDLKLVVSWSTSF
ncbi:TorF family putative porin [Bowmanella sp. JS7-9]|uniref:TorF family putative porin n=1 Tax=Pseudobowmanella zhangzhouensis TaxID=1537679 RepID=A0ABW1XEX7_9ALTE|nr:TorF family putative porin [Bowmanella sp. JS7-9]TBX20770.1 hypothetical protein TK45_13350 [Bowmanella sp. JS7-9]